MYSELSDSVSLVYARICFSTVTGTIFIGLQACVENYHKTKSTIVVANNQPIYKNKGGHCFQGNHEHTSFSQKSKDYYNEVT